MLQKNLMENRRKHLKVENPVILDSNAVDCGRGPYLVLGKQELHMFNERSKLEDMKKAFKHC